jgi:membrane-associated protease RseP (regulator of RpoE activity)
MRRLLSSCAIVTLVAVLAAPATTAAEAPLSAPSPSLGVRIDEAATVDGPGITVSQVTPGSTAAAMGLKPKDRIVSCNGTEVNRAEQLKAVLSGLTLGAQVTLELIRPGASTGEERMTVRGTLTSTKPIGTQLAELQQVIAEQRREIERLKQAPRKSLPELLRDLASTVQDIREQLPTAAEQFKAQYPNGRFSITLEVAIDSDTTAAKPVDLLAPPQEPATAPKP